MKAIWLRIPCILATLATSSLSQDSMYVYRYPTSNRFSEKVHANVRGIQSILRFDYRIVNSSSSEQSIWAFGVVTHSSVENVESPNGWVTVPGQIDPETPGVPWWAKDSTRFVAPNSELGGFSYLSSGLPAIRDYQIKSWVELPEAEVEPDSTVGGEEWKRGKSGNTIGPTSAPVPFVPTDFLDTLSSYVTRSLVLDWINNQQTTERYLAYFASARASIMDNNLPSARIALERTLQDVDVDSATSLTSEAYALLRYNTEYLLDHLPAGSVVSSYSLFATHSLWLEQNADVVSGDIGVNQMGSAPFLDSQVELSVGISTTTASGYSIKANRIKVKQGATVRSDVYYNTLENNGTITGLTYTPLTLPLVSTLPEFKTATPGSQNITIPQNSTETLEPGSYGDILVRKSGRLTFTGGTYHLASVNTGDNVQLVFQAPSEIRIAGKFDTDQGAYVGPEDTTSQSANQIVFYIGGINGSNGNLGATPKAAQIGIANTVKANFYVPNGTLWIRQNSQATGAFIGKDVDVGIGVKIWLKSAF